MINPKPAVARDLIDLAERMGIPTDDAIRRVVRHLTELQRPTMDPDAPGPAPVPVDVAADE